MRVVTRLGLSLAVAVAASSTSAAQEVVVRPVPLRTPEPIFREHGDARRYDHEAMAAGLVPLREARLRPGEREVRIWTKVELSGTVQLHRFTERDGRVRGEMVYAWDAGPPNESLGERTGETYHDHMLYRLRGACEGFAVAFERGACRARFQREPPWNRVLRQAEANGVWTLVDQDTLPHTGFTITIDGWSMVVELRDGASYRAYHYHCPWVHPEWRSATLATAIARSLQAIDSLMTRPDVRKVYRGLTTGGYGTAFRPCAGGDAWEFDNELRWMLKRAPASVRASAPPSALDSTARNGPLYEVEVLGELTPEWLARWRRDSRYARALLPVELRAVRVAGGEKCGDW